VLKTEAGQKTLRDLK